MEFFDPNGCAIDMKGYMLSEPLLQNCVFKPIGWLEGMKLGVTTDSQNARFVASFQHPSGLLKTLKYVLYFNCCRGKKWHFISIGYV